MTAYMQSDDGTIVRDFAQRTLDNLRFIEKQYALFKDGQSDTEVYEVTQLINSMLGLLVFPKEEFWEYLKPLSFNEIPAGVCPFRRQKGKTPNLRQLIRVIRNSFSHFNFEIKHNAGYISRIKMHNEWEGQITWEDEVSVFDLREFVEWFIKGVISSELLTQNIETIKAA